MSNEYTPWVELGISEVEYWKRRYSDARNEMFETLRVHGIKNTPIDPVPPVQETSSSLSVPLASTTQTVTTEKCKRCGGWHSCIHEPAPTVEKQGCRNHASYQDLCDGCRLASSAPADSDLERRIANQRDTITRLASALRTLLGNADYEDPFHLMDESNRAIEILQLKAKLAKATRPDRELIEELRQEVLSAEEDANKLRDELKRIAMSDKLPKDYDQATLEKAYLRVLNIANSAVLISEASDVTSEGDR